MDESDSAPRRGEEGSDRESSAGTPRWVKVFGIITLAVVLLFLVLKLTGAGGRHGPGRHFPSRDTSAQAAPEGSGG